MVDAVSLRAGVVGDGWLPQTARAMSHAVQQGTSREAQATAQEFGRLPYSRASFERVAHLTTGAGISITGAGGGFSCSAFTPTLSTYRVRSGHLKNSPLSPIETVGAPARRGGARWLVLRGSVGLNHRSRHSYWKSPYWSHLKTVSMSVRMLGVNWYFSLRREGIYADIEPRVRATRRSKRWPLTCPGVAPVRGAQDGAI